MSKVDFKKTLDSYRAKYHQFRIVDVPRLQYLMIDGHGDPNTAKEFADAIVALYPIAYKLKFASKLELGKDYTVMPLEGLWWSDNTETFTSARDKSRWDWTLMIMQPDWITKDMFKAAVQKVAEIEPPMNLAKMRLGVLDEGKCVQTLHIGSYDNEADVLAKMHHEFIPANNLKMVKKHHEIYLSDFRRVAPDRLRTILSAPFHKYLWGWTDVIARKRVRLNPTTDYETEHLGTLLLMFSRTKERLLTSLLSSTLAF